MSVTTPHQPAPAPSSAAPFPLPAIAAAAVGELGATFWQDWQAAPGRLEGSARIAPANGRHGFTLTVDADGDLTVVDEIAETFIKLWGRTPGESVGALAQAVADTIRERLERDAQEAAVEWARQAQLTQRAQDALRASAHRTALRMLAVGDL